jgi:hypothetical protein
MKKILTSVFVSALFLPLAVFAQTATNVSSSNSTASSTPSVALVSDYAYSKITATSTAQVLHFGFTFKVTSYGKTIYISRDSDAFKKVVHNAETGAIYQPTTTLVSSSAEITPDGKSYVVNSGQTAIFSVLNTYDPKNYSFYYETLDILRYGTTYQHVLTKLLTLPNTFATSAVAG